MEARVGARRVSRARPLNRQFVHRMRRGHPSPPTWPKGSRVKCHLWPRLRGEASLWWRTTPTLTRVRCRLIGGRTSISLSRPTTNILSREAPTPRSSRTGSPIRRHSLRSSDRSYSRVAAIPGRRALPRHPCSSGEPPIEPLLQLWQSTAPQARQGLRSRCPRTSGMRGACSGG